MTQEQENMTMAQINAEKKSLQENINNTVRSFMERTGVAKVQLDVLGVKNESIEDGEVNTTFSTSTSARIALF